MHKLIAKQTQNICIPFVQQRSNVFDIGQTLYTCYTNVLCLLGVYVCHVFSMIRLISWNEAQLHCASQNMTLLQYTHDVEHYGLQLSDFPADHDWAQIMFLGYKRNPRVF